MYKVLVIGCGNIGAQYDINNNEIQTHVKAWYLNNLTNVSVFDLNEKLVLEVANKYECQVVDNISRESLSQFDIISVCTPTFTHFEILENILASGVKVVICEKPVSNKVEEMILLKEIYKKSKSKILVNYLRRFQQDYSNLKDFVKVVLVAEKLTNISIRYQRGFINNCSHALDLLEFLVDKQIAFDSIKTHNGVFDQFDNDETLSLMAFWDNVNVNILGLGNVLFSHFEIDLYFEKHKILIKNAGNIIEIYKTEDKSTILLPLIFQEKISKEDSLKNYMVPVVDYAIKLMNNPKLKDNFINSIDLNLKMLNYKDN